MRAGYCALDAPIIADSETSHAHHADIAVSDDSNSLNTPI